jgi:Topoisomerase IA
VGRPSTYASIIGTIVDRGYAKLITNALIPTFTAFAVTTLLETYFPDLVDTGFTSRMEQTLDEIATGEAKWLPYLDKFYLIALIAIAGLRLELLGDLRLGCCLSLLLINSFWLWGMGMGNWELG